MKYRYLTLIFLLISGPYSIRTVRADDPVPVPEEEFQEALFLDGNYNILNRENQILPQSVRVPKPVTHYDIPDELVKRYSSEEYDLGPTFHFQKDGKSYTRFFLVDDPGFPLKEFDKKFVEFRQPQRYWAQRMQSKGTYFVYSADKTEVPFYTKMYRKINGVDYNDFSSGKVGVEMNDQILRILRSDPNAPFDILPETLAAQVDGSYSQVIRQVYPTRSPLDGVKTKIYPLHGFLGRFREAMTEDWIQNEYLPKLAELNARSWYEYGIVFESHSQNLLIELDPVSGKISRFIVKDLSDASMDGRLRTKRKIQTDYAHYKNIRFLDGWEEREFDTNGNIVTRISGNFSGLGIFYQSQPIIDNTPNANLKRKYLGIYLKEYITSIERSSGKKIHLSESATQYLNALSDLSVEIPISKKFSDRKPIYQALGEIIADIRSEVLTTESHGIEIFQKVVDV